MGFSGVMRLPSFRVRGVSTGPSGSLRLPSFTLGGRRLSGSFNLPAFKLAGTGVMQPLGGRLDLPGFSVHGLAYGALTARGRLVLSAFRPSGAIYVPIHASGQLSLARFKISGRSPETLIVRGRVALPSLVLSGHLPVSLSVSGQVNLAAFNAWGFSRIEAVFPYRKATVMHLFNHSITHYENYPFESLAHFNGLFLGANEDGILVIDGDNDLGEPIVAEVDTGVWDSAEKGAVQRLREIWLAGRWNEGMEIEAIGDETRLYPSSVFELIREKIREQRQKLRKGIKARFFTFRVRNVAGSDFDIHSLRVLGEQIKRKTR
jgi:hypothetical protein